MVEVTYYCPYCRAVTTLDREGYLADRSVTQDPLDGYEYAATTDEYADADGVEIVCLGDADASVHTSTDRGPDPAAEGCGRTFYLNFVKYADGERVDPEGGWLEDEPSFEFLR